MTDVIDRPTNRAPSGTMQVLDTTGHSTTTWNKDNADEVAAARATFDAMKAKGYTAFKVRGNGQQGARMDTFDPEAESMVMVPQLKGG